MNKILIVIVLSALGLNAQSKLYPNNAPEVSLKQSLMANTLRLADTEHIITKVFLYNKETLEHMTYDNESNSIDIDLNEVLAGFYTAMVYVKGDIIVFKILVKNDKIEGDIGSSKVALKDKGKTIRYYRVIATLNNGSNVTWYNVFTEKQKNDLLRKNIYDIVSPTGRKNKLVLSAVYADYSEEIIYKTAAP